jgi:hypothetical protein
MACAPTWPLPQEGTRLDPTMSTGPKVDYLFPNLDETVSEAWMRSSTARGRAGGCAAFIETPSGTRREMRH